MFNTSEKCWIKYVATFTCKCRRKKLAALNMLKKHWQKFQKLLTKNINNTSNKIDEKILATLPKILKKS
jgi:hypothetical protein